VRLYEIHLPEFDCVVKFKALQAEEVSDFVMALGEIEEQEFVKSVLNHFIFNMRTDVKSQLRKMSKDSASRALKALYNGCVFLNPGLDIDNWLELSFMLTKKTFTSGETAAIDSINDQLVEAGSQKKKSKAIPRRNILNLEENLNREVIGQQEATSKIASALRRSLAGLNDPERPLGIFMFAGSSGVGKTFLAKNLQKALFGVKSEIARIDCGEFQEKHQALTLLGSPPSYIGYDEENGGVLSQIIERGDRKVLLLDEVEKADPSLWNLFLRIFDEGKVTDSRGVELDFRNMIIIMTTNLGNETIVKEISGTSAGFGARIDELHQTKEMPKHSIVEKETRKAIKNHFKIEFLNRIDDIVVFKHLHPDQYGEIAQQELDLVTKKLKSKGMNIIFDEAAIIGLVTKGVDTLHGARGMSKIRRTEIESQLADMIINLNLKKGTKFSVTCEDSIFDIDVAKMPTIKKKA
jgi:ATP-dependent Clp protease ATP-binding subunit ClpC